MQVSYDQYKRVVVLFTRSDQAWSLGGRSGDILEAGKAMACEKEETTSLFQAEGRRRRKLICCCFGVFHHVGPPP